MQSRALLPALFTCGLALLFVAGCASRSGPPLSTSSLPIKRDGISIVTISYSAADTGKVRPNQIANTASGDVLVDGPVDLALRKTLRQVLQRAGFESRGPVRLLSSEITEFLADDLGFGVEWTLRIRYAVRDAAGTTLYEATKVTQRSTTKFVNVANTCDDLLDRNVTDLVADDTFRQVVR